jgi:hypothetical protein
MQMARREILREKEELDMSTVSRDGVGVVESELRVGVSLEKRLNGPKYSE